MSCPPCQRQCVTPCEAYYVVACDSCERQVDNDDLDERGNCAECTALVAECQECHDFADLDDLNDSNVCLWCQE